MKTKGKLTGNYLLTTTAGTDACLGPTYYDASSVYRQIGVKYPADPLWLQYQAKAELCYRDYYVMRSDVMGGVPGYWVFPEGFRLDFDATGDTKSKDAIHALATKASYCSESTPVAWIQSAALSREVAYCLMTRLHDEQLGQPHMPYTDVIFEAAIGHMNQWLSYQAIAPVGMDGAPECVSMNYVQPFMMGLTMRALIMREAFKHDARIAPLVKEGVDYLQLQHYDATKKAFTYENCTAPGGGPWIRPKTGAPDLNMLIVPAYGWVWTKTGVDTYKTNGDAIWNGGTAGAYLDQGKQFDQNYTWSFSYPTWRNSPAVPLRLGEAPARVKLTRPVTMSTDIPKAMRPTTKLFPDVPKAKQ